MTTSIQTPASEILRDAYLAADAEGIRDFDRRGTDDIDAIRIGDQVLTMSDGRDDAGQPCDGYAYTYGILEDGSYVDESGAQWADTEAEAREAIARWIAFAQS